jgi:hypothetical protein
MVCEAMHGLDAMETTPDVQHHGHSMQSIKKYMGEHYKVCLGSPQFLSRLAHVLGVF